MLITRGNDNMLEIKHELLKSVLQPVDTGKPYSEYSNKGKTFITVTH